MIWGVLFMYVYMYVYVCVCMYVYVCVQYVYVCVQQSIPYPFLSPYFHYQEIICIFHSPPSLHTMGHSELIVPVISLLGTI